MEIWKDISGYEGLYQVSDCGQVKSCERFVWNRQGNHVLKERILKPRLNTTGYHYVGLHKDGKAKNFLVHRLVALVFLDGDNSLTVNHIDECKTNNHVSNLEYLTQGDNTRSWNRNNPERKSENLKKATEGAIKSKSWEKANNVTSQQVLDTQTGKTFPSIKAVGRYMYEEEGAKGPYAWFTKIIRGQQDRFQIIENECER